MNYTTYRAMIDELFANGKTTGADQSEAMIHYTELNIQRMKRLDKTTTLNEGWNNIYARIKEPIQFKVLTEAWCGDAAQIVPVINKIAEESQGKIVLDLLLRDENLDLMDQYLTNGGRSIPKLICYDANNTELWNWGPRPAGAQALINTLKAEQKPMEEIKTQLHLWYTKNKTEETQEELMRFFTAQ